MLSSYIVFPISSFHDIAKNLAPCQTPRGGTTVRFSVLCTVVPNNVKLEPRLYILDIYISRILNYYKFEYLKLMKNSQDR